jgi:hypothetical protein
MHLQRPRLHGHLTPAKLVKVTTKSKLAKDVTTQVDHRVKGVRKEVDKHLRRDLLKRGRTVRVARAKGVTSRAVKVSRSATPGTPMRGSSRAMNAGRHAAARGSATPFAGRGGFGRGGFGGYGGGWHGR